MAERTPNKEGWGRLFRNRFKTATNRAPDFTGHLTVDGVERKLVGWRRTTAIGTKYLNVELKPAPAADDTTAPPPDARARTGRNAPTPEEGQRVALLDQTLVRLLAKGITQADIADQLGVSTSAVSHLRRDLQSYSFGRRQAAERLLGRLVPQAEVVLADVRAGAGS